VILPFTTPFSLIYTSGSKKQSLIAKDGSREVPLHLRNAPTKLMKQLDYGKDYHYTHEEAEDYAAGENYFPDGMPPVNFYQPVERGLEAAVKKRM
jgi:putative ATPase